MKKTLTITLLMLAINTFAQTLKTYSGNYPLSQIFVGQNGTATYKYFDDPENYTRIKNGPFTFNLKGTGDYSGVQMIVTGNYKNNLKNGTWIIKLLYTDLKSDGKYMNGSDVITANYSDGYLSGTFSYVSTYTTRKKVYNNAKRVIEFGPPTQPKTEKLIAKFRKDKDKVLPNNTGNILVGNFKYEISDPNISSSFTVTAKLDSIGIFNGKYVLNDTKTERIFEFSDCGILKKSIERNLQSGEADVVNRSSDYEDNVCGRIHTYNNSSPDTLKLLNESYKTYYKTLSSTFNDNSLDFGYFKLKKVLEGLMFCEDFKGDVNYDKGAYKFDGFLYRKIEKK